MEKIRPECPRLRYTAAPLNVTPSLVATAETLDSFLEAKIRHLIEQGCCQGWYAVGVPSTKKPGSALTYFSAASRSRSQMPSGSGFGKELQLQLQPNRARPNGLDKIPDRVYVRSIKLGSNTEDRDPQYYRGRQQSDSPC